MSRIGLFNQPFGNSLGPYLSSLISSGDYNKLNIVVAFAKNGGVSTLEKAIADFKERGGSAFYYVGFDLDGTSYEALTALFNLADALYLMHSNSLQTFHPKIYNLVGEQEAVLIVGSNNLTGGGLRTNAESSLVVFLSLDNPEDAVVQAEVDNYLQALREDDATCKKIDSLKDLEELLAEGIIHSEAYIRERETQRRSADKQRKASEKFKGRFGTGIRDAGMPTRPHSTQGEAESPAASAQWQPAFITIASSMWVETGKGTGGSNNQLDLSMTAVIAPGDPGNEQGVSKKRTEGSVCFFGIDPETTDKAYTIDISYNGQLFIGSEIKIYKGEGKGSKPNGTWRIYLCGVCDDVKLSQALKAVGLAQKLAVFTKLGNNRYLLELREESELEDYRALSEIVAHNGSRLEHRAFGLLI